MEPDAPVLLVAGPIGPADAARLCDEVSALVGITAAPLVACDVAAVEAPSVGTVDALARLALAARRLGSAVRLCRPSGELQELVALVGLADVLASEPDLGVEPWREPEQREEARGVEEERDAADQPV